MIKIVHVTKEVWDKADWKNEFDAATTDYLRRSHEEVDEKTLWSLIAAAIADSATSGIMLAVGFKDGVFAGYGLFRVEAGNEATGRLLHCWQLYSKPGVSSLPELYAAAESYIILACRQFGITRMTLQTRRWGRAFDKLYGRFGFKPYAMAYQAPVPPYTREEIMAALKGESNEPAVQLANNGGNNAGEGAKQGARKRRRRRHHSRGGVRRVSGQTAESVRGGAHLGLRPT